MEIGIIIPSYNVRKEMIEIKRRSTSEYENKLKNLFLKKLSNEISNGIFYSSKEISQFIVVYLSYLLYRENIEFTLKKSVNFNCLYFNCSYKLLYNYIDKLPEKYNQITIDEYCDVMLADSFSIKHFIYTRFNQEHFLFSEQIAKKYDYLINANKFDLL